MAEEKRNSEGMQVEKEIYNLFYSDNNLKAIDEGIRRLDRGLGQEHELIEEEV